MAGTIVETRTGTGHVRRLTFACTADAVDGTFPAHVVAENFRGGARLIRLVVDPGGRGSASMSSSRSSSASQSPSSSRSPSQSASGSVSASVSPSSSRSPSSSASPSLATPTDNVDVTLTDAHGLDLLQGLGANADALTVTDAPIVYASTSVHPVVMDESPLVLHVGDNVAPSAQLTVEVWYALGY